MFRGYPEFKETDTFWKLPCDQGIDEILLGILIVMIIRLIVTALAIFEEVSKLKYVQANDSEPMRFGGYLTMIKWVRRIETTTTVVFGFLLWFLYDYTTRAERCKYNAPEIYWTSVFFMVYASVVAILLSLRLVRDRMLVDADPGVCNKTCQQKFSANVMILPWAPVPMSLLGPAPGLYAYVLRLFSLAFRVSCVCGSLNHAGRFIAVISRHLCCPFALLGKRLFLRSTSSGSLSIALVL